GVEHVEGGGVLLRIDDNEPIGVVGEDFEALNLAQHFALAVDHDQRRRIGALQVIEDQVLQQLRFAVAGAGDDLRVLESDIVGNLERYRRKKKIEKWRANEIGFNQLGGRQFGFAGQNKRSPRFLVVRSDIRCPANVFVESLLQARKQSYVRE